jgi:hypothetical protein
LKEAQRKNAELETKVAGTEQTLNYYSDRLATAEADKKQTGTLKKWSGGATGGANQDQLATMR